MPKEQEDENLDESQVDTMNLFESVDEISGWQRAIIAALSDFKDLALDQDTQDEQIEHILDKFSAKILSNCQNYD